MLVLPCSVPRSSVPFVVWAKWYCAHSSLMYCARKIWSSKAEAMALAIVAGGYVRKRPHTLPQMRPLGKPPLSAFFYVKKHANLFQSNGLERGQLA